MCEQPACVLYADALYCCATTNNGTAWSWCADARASAALRVTSPDPARQRPLLCSTLPSVAQYILCSELYIPLVP
eukprot:13516190-Heterocapsa_arctica.AAC.1